MRELIIDGTNLLLGRLASYSAKQVLLGNKVDIVNSEKVVVSGKKEDLIAHYKHRRDIGEALKGPYYPRTCDRLLRRAIRGMLPYKQYKGKIAYKRVMCYIGVPDTFKDKKPISLKEAHVSRMESIKFMNLQQIVRFI